jgi:hypothetical protein
VKTRKSELKKGEDLMKTTTKSKRRTPVLRRSFVQAWSQFFWVDVRRDPKWQHTTPVIIRQAIIGRTTITVIHIRTITGRHDRTVVRSGIRYNDASGRATTPGLFTATGINLRSAIG